MYACWMDTITLKLPEDYFDKKKGRKKMTETELEKELESLKKQILIIKDLIENKKKQKVKPEIDETYYFIESGGEIDNTYWTNDEGDNFRFDTNNCFKNLSEASVLDEILDTERQLIKYAKENNTEKIDWTNKDQEKWYLYYNWNSNKICLGLNAFSKNARVIYFTDSKIATEAYETIGTERVIRYLKGL